MSHRFKIRSVLLPEALGIWAIISKATDELGSWEGGNTDMEER